MPDNIDFEMTMRDGQVDVALQNLFQKTTKVEEGMGKVGRAAKRAGKDGKEAIDAWQRQLEKTRESQDTLTRSAFVNARAAKDSGNAWEASLKRTAAAAKEASDAAAKAAKAPVDAFVSAKPADGSHSAWQRQLDKTNAAQGLSRDAFVSAKPTATGGDAWAQQLAKTTAARKAETDAIEAQKKATDDLAQAQRDTDAQKLADELEHVAKEAKKADAELTRFAEDTKRINSTPLERYQQKMVKLNTALAMGKLEQKDFSRATDAARQKLEEESKAAEKAADATKDLGQHTKAAGDAAQDLLSTLGGYGSAAAGIAKVVDNFRAMLEFTKQQRAEGGQSVKDDFEVIAGIAQLSGGDQGTVDRRYAENRALREEHGLNRETMWTMQESAISNSNEASMERFASTSAAGNPGERMRTASKLESLSGGKIDEVRADAAIITAAAPSPYSVEEFARAVPTASEAAIRMGSSPEEGLAVLSTMSDKLTSPDRAADRINRIQTEMARDERFQGKGLVEGLDTLAAMPSDERHKFMGESIEMDTAFNKYIENRGEVDVRRKAIEQSVRQVGTAEDPVLAIQRTFEGTAQGKAALENRKAVEKAENAKSTAFGVQNVQVDTVKKTKDAEAITRGEEGWRRFNRSTAHETADFFGASPQTTAAVSDAGAVTPWDFLKLLFSGQQKSQSDHTQALKDNTAALRSSKSAPARPQPPNPAPTKR